jgi:hypothetical protein
MTVEYNGKRPNKLWYAGVKTWAMLTSIKDKSARPDVLNCLKNVGIGVGILAASIYLVGPLLPAAPLVQTIAGIAGVMTACHFAINKAWPSFRRVYDGGYCAYVVDKAESAWLKRQMRPGLLTRAKNAFGKKAEAAEPGPVQPFQTDGIFGDDDVKNRFNASATDAPETAKPKGPNPPTGDYKI